MSTPAAAEVVETPTMSIDVGNSGDEKRAKVNSATEEVSLWYPYFCILHQNIFQLQ